MLSVYLIAVGGINQLGFSTACSEYSKRLGAFCKLTIIEIPESPIPKNPSAAQILKLIELEGAAISSKLPPKAYTVALCIEGKQLSSQNLADVLAKVSQTNSQLAFIIGSSHGLSQSLKNNADLKLSFSAMTFPHQLARVIMLEQLYRAFSINNGGRYHK